MKVESEKGWNEPAGLVVGKAFMDKKRLPEAVQVFREIRKGGFYYVDKTAYISKLVQESNKNIFLSRPRRFGKSLFVDTLKEAFGGSKELFEGLDLYDNWDWSAQYPVIHLDFSTGNYLKEHTILQSMDVLFRDFERWFGVTAAGHDPEFRLLDLINALYHQTGNQVVLLVDEYDKPILDAIEAPDVAISNRNELRGLYGVTKTAASRIKFAFFTGVSRFAKTSLFSGVNNLKDITIEPEYSAICGYTESDLDSVFAPELEGLNREKIQEWYHGYSWLGSEKVYNPYDILYCFMKHEFEPWWFRTGSPAFLIETLRKKQVMSVDLDLLNTRVEPLESFDVDKIDPKALLFQAGYLTIAEKIQEAGGTRYILDYPNREVRESLNRLFLEILLPDEAEYLLEECTSLLEILSKCNKEEMKTLFQKVVAGLLRQWHASVDLTRYEAYFASAFYSYFMGAGLDVRAEDATNRGRIDLAVIGPAYIYLFEFKMVNGKKPGSSIEQIRDMNYAQKYRGTGKTVYLGGIEFSKSERSIVYFDVIEDDGGDGERVDGSAESK